MSATWKDSWAPRSCCTVGQPTWDYKMAQVRVVEKCIQDTELSYALLAIWLAGYSFPNSGNERNFECYMERLLGTTLLLYSRVGSDGTGKRRSF
jgi:hypothetical protein